MDRWSLYDLDLDLELQGHEIYVFGHNFSYICCGLFKYISYCWLWIDGHCMILNLAFDLDLQRCWRRYAVSECYISSSLCDLVSRKREKSCSL